MHSIAGLVSLVLRTQLPKSGSRYLLANFLQPKWSPLAYLLCFEKQPEAHAQFGHFILSLLHCVPGMQSWKDSVSYLKMFLSNDLLDNGYLFCLSHTSLTASCAASFPQKVINAYPLFWPDSGSIIRRRSQMGPAFSKRGTNSSSYKSLGILPTKTWNKTCVLESQCNKHLILEPQSLGAFFRGWGHKDG